MSGAIGAKALYFLFIWLISAAGASWLSERKGYGERAKTDANRSSHLLPPEVRRPRI